MLPFCRLVSQIFSIFIEVQKLQKMGHPTQILSKLIGNVVKDLRSSYQASGAPLRTYFGEKREFSGVIMSVERGQIIK